MNKSKGFTLIEMVVVIIVLGIMASVAAPKFFNLKKDAVKASVAGLYDSVRATTELSHEKAMLLNVEKSEDQTLTSEDGTEIKLAYGYPTNESVKALISESGLHSYEKLDNSAIYAYPSLVIKDYDKFEDLNCYVKYVPASDSNNGAKVTYKNTGC